MPAIGSAPTKLLLFGDHAAVYGYPALGIPLPWKLTVTLFPSSKMEWDIAPKYLEQLDPILSKIQEIFPELHSTYRILVESDAPIGMGFGSSGALCVALTRAIFSELGLEPTTEDIWNRAHQLETYFHSSPSGVDTGISTWESGGYFAKNGDLLPSFQPLIPINTPLVIGAIPRQGNTGSLVSDLRERLTNSKSLMEHIKQLGAIAEKAPNVLNSPEQFGVLANQAHHHLVELGLSTPELDQILEDGIAMGALGGKVSGAGGGGAFFFVCPSKEIANIIKENSHNLKLLVL